ncbi:MAG: hypothetical protein WAX77_01950, partial [Methylococcaceae bacterium]
MSEENEKKPIKLTGDNVDRTELPYGLKSEANTNEINTNPILQPFNGREFSEALAQIEDTRYVFFFGQEGSGKSVIIGSLLRILNEGNAYGRFILN